MNRKAARIIASRRLYCSASCSRGGYSFITVCLRLQVILTHARSSTHAQLGAVLSADKSIADLSPRCRQLRLCSCRSHADRAPPSYLTLWSPCWTYLQPLCVALQLQAYTSINHGVSEVLWWCGAHIGAAVDVSWENDHFVSATYPGIFLRTFRVRVYALLNSK